MDTEEEGIVLEVPELCYSWLTQLRCYMWVSLDNQPVSYQSFDGELDPLQYTADNASDVELNSDDFPLSVEQENSDSFEYIDYDAYDHIESQLKYLLIYLSPFIMLLSTFGNLFSVVILCKLCHEVWSSCVYLVILAMLDQIIIFVWCGNNWMYQITFRDITNEILISSSSLCKVYTFAFNYIFHMQKWLLVCLSVECFIASKYPVRVSHMCTLSKAKAIVLLLIVILACLNIHFFWTFEVENVSGQTEAYVYFGNKQFRCNFVSKGFQFSEVFEGLVWPITDIVTAQITPLAIITVTSSLAVYHMKFGSESTKSTQQAEHRKYLLYPNALRQLKMSFIVINLSYTILTIPRLAMTIYKVYLYHHSDNNLDVVTRSKLDLITAMTFFMEYVFLSIKFYVLIVGCKLFREKFIRLCKSICRCVKVGGNPLRRDTSALSGLNSSREQRKGLISQSMDRSDTEAVHYINHNTRSYSPKYLRDISVRVTSDRDQTVV